MIVLRTKDFYGFLGKEPKNIIFLKRKYQLFMTMSVFNRDLLLGRRRWFLGLGWWCEKPLRSVK